jgi:uncharacterized RDD family membrane protein YckC
VPTYLTYANFWQRFAAAWIDVFVLVPVIILDEWLSGRSRLAALVLVVPAGMVYFGYVVYCHGRFGQTVGKHVMGIRVLTVAGERIGWRGAWARSAVDLAFTVLGMVASFIALSAAVDAAYAGLSWPDRMTYLTTLTPHWFNWAGFAATVWTWSEVIVMLFNERRRALHDFIAGTVVVAD